jgi:hypothetical protein
MRITIWLALLSIFSEAGAQSLSDYVPCSEMPSLMQQFQADQDALERFYSPNSIQSYNNDYNGFSTPEMRERLVKLDKEYLEKLRGIDFDKLPQ